MDNEELQDGAHGLSSLSVKTAQSNHFRMLSQRQHFLLSFLKNLSVGTARVQTCELPESGSVENVIFLLLYRHLSNKKTPT